MPGFWEEYFDGVHILNWENLYFVLGLKGRQAYGFAAFTTGKILKRIVKSTYMRILSSHNIC